MNNRGKDQMVIVKREKGFGLANINVKELMETLQSQI